MIVSVNDVAAYINEKYRGSDPKLTGIKLQKLLYYCQAWSLVWNEEPLFHEDIQAWTNGPVIRELYEQHQGKLYVDEMSFGNSSVLTEVQKETVDSVIQAYGDKTGQWLSDLTHLEAPWQEARTGLAETERGSTVISLAALYEYYSGLNQEDNCLNGN